MTRVSTLENTLKDYENSTRASRSNIGTNNLGFYGDRDGAFRSSGLNVNSPSGMWQMIVITGQASDTTREFVFVLSTTGMGYACAYRRTGSTCSQFTPPSSVNVWWGDSSSSTTCYRDCVETTSIGTQHVYLGTIEEAPIFVGSTDRVATGTWCSLECAKRENLNRIQPHS